jgi:hypothetical protein
VNKNLLRTARLAIALAALMVAAAAWSPALAVPVFARKYQTSCGTCHTIFPKLNAFGEAFRLNGYRMPAETEEQVKEVPVSLGAEAGKKAWPAVVWPNTIPGHTPLAVNVKMEDVFASSHDESGRAMTRNDFQFPQEVNLFAAGTLGDRFGFLGELTYGETPEGGAEVEIEHAQLTVNSPFGPEHAFNFKVGKFAPDLADGFQEMWLMTDNGVDTLFGYSPIGAQGGDGVSDNGGIGLPDNVKAIEVYGVTAHRFFYTVGMTNGLGPVQSRNSADTNSSRDYYARVDYKFGGMGLDGDTSGVNLPPENWRERSVRIGLFGYTGDGSQVDFALSDTLTVRDDRYDRAGVYVSWYFRDLNVFGVALHGKDRLVVTDAEAETETQSTRSYDSWFVQADYVFRPPFQASLRYESLNPADPEAESVRLANANFSWLFRANMKFMAEYRRDLNDSLNYTLAGVLRFAF